jgi:hypothetical protein
MADAIAAWVEGHVRATTVDGVTLYDLSEPTARSTGTAATHGGS